MADGAGGYPLAAAAECELIATDVIILLGRKSLWGVLALPIGWIAFYSLVLFIGGRISALDPRDPSVANYPKFTGQLVTVRQPQFLAAICLIGFPAVMTLMEAVILYSAVTGDIHA